VVLLGARVVEVKPGQPHPLTATRGNLEKIRLLHEDRADPIRDRGYAPTSAGWVNTSAKPNGTGCSPGSKE
jgi:hypothetical protein